MQVYSVNNAPSFGARLKIKSDIKDQLADATTIGGFTSSVSSLLSGYATDGMMDVSAMHSKLISAKFQTIAGNIKSFLKDFFE